MRVLFHLILSCLAVGVAAWLLPGVTFANWESLIAVAVVMGVVNILIKPVLSLLLLPLNILTLGLLGLLVNGLIILLIGRIVPGFTVDTLWSAILFSILLSLISLFFSVLKRA